MTTILEDIRSLLILEENLNMLGSKYSFDDYRKFYEEKFPPISIPEELRIDNGTIIRGEDEVNDNDESATQEQLTEDEAEEDIQFGF